MSAEEDLMIQLKLNREHWKRLWGLNNKLLAVKIERLNLLRQHYQDHWLDLDLKSYDSKLDSLVSRTRFTVHQTSMKRVDELIHKYNQESAMLDEQIADVQARLEKFNNLDPDLLTEYRKLKDDLECQELLIKISENNVPK